MSIFEQPKHVYKFGLMRARWLAVCKYKITGFGLYSVYTVYTTNRRSLKQPQLAAGSVSGWISFGELQCERNLHRQVGIMFADLRRTWQFPHIVPLAVNTELGTRQCDAWFQATKILIMELWPYSSWHRGHNIFPSFCCLWSSYIVPLPLLLS